MCSYFNAIFPHLPYHTPSLPSPHFLLFHRLIFIFLLFSFFFLINALLPLFPSNSPIPSTFCLSLYTWPQYPHPPNPPIPCPPPISPRIVSHPSHKHTPQNFPPHTLHTHTIESYQIWSMQFFISRCVFLFFITCTALAKSTFLFFFSSPYFLSLPPLFHKTLRNYVSKHRPNRFLTWARWGYPQYALLSTNHHQHISFFLFQTILFV